MMMGQDSVALPMAYRRPFLGISTFLIGVPLTVLSFFGLGDWCSRTLAVLWARSNAFMLGMRVSLTGFNT